MNKLQVFEGKDGQWYWHVRDEGNHAVTSVGGEGFHSKEAVIKAAEDENPGLTAEVVTAAG